MPPPDAPTVPDRRPPAVLPRERFPYPIRLVLTALGLAALVALALVLLWYVADILLLAFAGIILAIFLRGLSEWVAPRIHLAYGWSLTVVVVVLAMLVGFLCWLLASHIAGQIDQLQNQLPQALQQLEQRLNQYQWGRVLVKHVREYASQNYSEEKVMAQATSVLKTAFDAWIKFLMVMLIGLYGAITPRVYVQGVVLLVPSARRPRLQQALNVVGDLLWWWLVCRLISMTWVGITTWIALQWLGVPLALTLGFVAGLSKFIPYIGPFVAVVPAALLALLPPHGFGTVLWVIGIYLVIEMIDDHIILPLLNWRTIWLPPALAIFSQVVLAALWGGLAVVLAMPLVAVVMVLVKILYVHGTLGEPIELGRSTVSASAPSGGTNGRQAES